MNVNLNPILGADSDLVRAQRCRSRAVVESIETFRDQLAKLQDKWGATAQ
jgi:hypothetical protein